MKDPLIGLSLRLPSAGGHNLNSNYPAAILRGGGAPIAVPMGAYDYLDEYADMLDGLILTGGGDVDPQLFGEEALPQVPTFDRVMDDGEIALCRAMVQRGKPVMGICRGIQVMNVALGGNLWQDIPAQVPGHICHRSAPQPENPVATHPVTIEEDSILYALLGKKETMTNSIHHQAVKDPAPGLKVTARTADGLIEALESADGLVIGFQWHPEAMRDNPDSHAIFKWFVDKCRK